MMVQKLKLQGHRKRKKRKQIVQCQGHEGQSQSSEFKVTWLRYKSLGRGSCPLDSQEVKHKSVFMYMRNYLNTKIFRALHDES